MKKIYQILILVSVLFVSGCTKDDDFDRYEPDNHVREVSVNLSLIMINKNSISHSYEYFGYDISFTGANLVEGDVHLTNQNLQDFTMSLLVTGDIQITVSHPSFVKDAIVKNAFYGIENLTLPTKTQKQVAAELELQQGFTVITAVSGAENFVTGQTINGTIVELNKPFYTAASKVTVLVESTLGEVLEGSHQVILGEGTIYTVKIKNGNIEFSLPAFGDPGEGELVETIQVTKDKYYKPGNRNGKKVDAIKISPFVTEANLNNYQLSNKVTEVIVSLSDGSNVFVKKNDARGKTLKQILDKKNIGIENLEQGLWIDLYENKQGEGEAKIVNVNLLVIYRR